MVNLIIIVTVHFSWYWFINKLKDLILFRVFNGILLTPPSLIFSIHDPLHGEKII